MQTIVPSYPCIYCVIFENGDPYKIAIKGNSAEDVYAKMDLFDMLSIIQKLKENGLTQKEIGEKIGWSRDQIKNHNRIIKGVGTEGLEFTKQHQKGRVPENGTIVPFDFTEGWFRTSGLYNLNDDYQLKGLQDFIKDKCKWSKEKLQKQTKKYEQWQDFIKISENKLVDQLNLSRVIGLIENNTFKTEDQLTQKLNDLNKKSKNKYHTLAYIVKIKMVDISTIWYESYD